MDACICTVRMRHDFRHRDAVCRQRFAAFFSYMLIHLRRHPSDRGICISLLVTQAYKLRRIHRCHLMQPNAVGWRHSHLYRLPLTVAVFFQLYAFSSSQTPKRRGRLYRSAFSYTSRNAVQTVCTISCFHSYCTGYFDGIPGYLSFDTVFCCLKSAFAHKILASVSYGRQRTVCSILSFPSLQSFTEQFHFPMSALCL